MTSDYTNNKNFGQDICNIGAGCIVTNHTKNKILLIERKDGEGWCVPGGNLLLGESPEITAIRETKEETNTEVKNIKLIGIYSVKDKKGIPKLSIIYEAKYIRGKLKINHESKNIKWVSVSSRRKNLHLAFGLEKAITDWWNKK